MHTISSGVDHSFTTVMDIALTILELAGVGSPQPLRVLPRANDFSKR